MSAYNNIHFSTDATVTVTCNVHNDRYGIWEDGDTFAAITIAGESVSTTFFFRSLEQAQALVAAVAGIRLPAREEVLA